MDNPNSTRRAMFGALAVVPMLAVVPALAAPTGSASFAAAHARYIATRDALNNSPSGISQEHWDALSAQHSQAIWALDEATPTDWREFTLKLEALTVDLTPDEDMYGQFVTEAKRLLAGEG